MRWQRHTATTARSFGSAAGLYLPHRAQGLAPASIQRSPSDTVKCQMGP